MKKIKKNGIDFFPVNVSFISGISCRKLMKCCGIESVSVLLSLFSRIYEYEGYFIGFNEDLAFRLSDELGASQQEIITIITHAVELGIFDEGKFRRFGILTSQEIQDNFLFATKRRKDSSLREEYLIIAEPENQLSEESARIDYVNHLYTKTELSVPDVYKNEHSLNSIDSINSLNNTSLPNLKTTTVVDAVVDRGQIEKKKKAEVYRTKESSPVNTTPTIAGKSPTSTSPTPWRTNFEVYLNDLCEAYESLIVNEEYLRQKKIYYPDVDIVSSLEKMVLEFWGTQQGWEYKKKQFGPDINWQLTFDKQLNYRLNQVLKPHRNEPKRFSYAS